MNGGAMKVTNRYCIIWTVLTGILIPLMFGATAIAEPCDPWAAKLVSVQGEAMVKRNAQTEWGTIGFDDVLCMGDTLQVGKNSRASVMIAGEWLIRLDQQTTLRFPESDADNSFWVDLVQGVVHFFSHKPRHLKVLTPFVNGNIEGTEFIVTASLDQAEISVLQGRVRAINQLGELLLSAGQTARAQKGTAPVATQVRPEDAVQWALYYPVVSDFSYADLADNEEKAVKKALAAYQQGNPSKALTLLQNLPNDTDSAQLLNFRAGLSLMVGRVTEALEDTRQALQLKPDNSEALALQTVIAVTQNRKEEALVLAQKAVDANPHWANAYIAQSYAQQSNFQLDAALESVEKAVTLTPENGVAWSRLAELQLSKGELDQALTAARKAIEFDPNNAHAQTVLGFAYLTQIKIDPAVEAFQKAISLDQAAPLPRLGLGLATIRGGDLADGRREIEIAASLDSQNALIRSYLGKAYFDEKEGKLAGDQYEMAKTLDTNDPTAWLYDALRKQAANRPVEALQDLQKSIELNDNRAVYRSRLLLDQDLAARSASLGRIYNDLGFQQLALVEGWKSVNTNPANFSAHRFLADSYAALPRHEIARVSEILQSQLLQPINLRPIQPQLAESQLSIIDGTGPSDLSFNEYSQLFNRNRVVLQTNGVAGGNDTLGEDLVLSGIYGVNSFSLGQFHYETDGFRENNDNEINIYNAFYQVNPWYHTSIMAEYRSDENKFGDLPLRFSPDLFYTDERHIEESDSLRIGMRHAFSTHSNLIATLIFEDADSKLTNDFIDFDLSTEGYNGEAQYIVDTPSLNIIAGASYFDADEVLALSYMSGPPESLENTIRHTSAYLYSMAEFPQTVTWTFGGSYDNFDAADQTEQFNPKLGVSWDLLQSTTFRAAAFRTLQKGAIADQTIEPTQVAGFNQFFRNYQRDDIWRYGAAIDHTFTNRLFGGIEVSKRDIETSYLDLDLNEVWTDWEEELARVYLNWTPLNWLALSMGYQLERFERVLDDTGSEQILELETYKVPLGIKVFCPYGFTVELKPTYVDQKGMFDFNDFAFTGIHPEPGSDQFWTTDVAISYHLPRHYGMLTIEARNVFDEDFQFQSMDWASPELSPERLILFKLNVSF